MNSRLVGLSFDGRTSPQLTINLRRTQTGAPASWGVAWFPDDDAAASTVKEPAEIGDAQLQLPNRDWHRFTSSTFIVHTRGATKRTAQQDAQPFQRSFARRDIAFAHSGDLHGEVDQHLPLGDRAAFQPLGRTDSEHVFCWLLGQMHEAGVRTLADLGWPRLLDLLRHANGFGTLSIVLSDGMDLIGYRDSNNGGALHMGRVQPPHQQFSAPMGDLTLNISGARDSNRSALALTSVRPPGDGWNELEAGQLVVARRSELIWSGNQAEGRPIAVPGVVMQQNQNQFPMGIDVPEVARIERSAGHARSRPDVASSPLIRPRILSVEHQTSYSYDQPVEESSHFLRLQPVQDIRQELLSYELMIDPDGSRTRYEDVFGNQAVRFILNAPYSHFTIRMSARVRIIPEPLDNAPHGRATIPLVWMPWQRQLMHAYLLPPELPETQLQELSDYAMSFVERQDYDLLQTLRDINSSIYRNYQYLTGSTTLETTPFDVYASRKGVCQDFANLFICMARLLGVPSRYRVGYIYTGANYANKIQSEASHAWTEVYLPSIGWVGFDPTNGCEAGLDHIRVATGRNYRDATPTTGTIFKGGGTETLTVSVRVVEEG